MKSKVLALLIMAAAGSVTAGSLDPSTGPAPTMVTMSELYDNQTNLLHQVSLIASPQTLSASTTTVTAGFYAATDLVTVDADLSADNIRDGVVIFGIEGTVQSGASYSVGPWPTAGVITNGDALSSYTLNGGDATVAGTFTWTDGTVIPAVGVSTQSITFTPSDPADTPIQSMIVVTVAYDGRWVDNGDGTVTDLQESLMWVKAPGSLPGYGRKGLTDANSFCLSLDYAGYSDWRLPTVEQNGGGDELETLWAYGSWTGKPSTPFTGIASWIYRSSVLSGSSSSYVVDFQTGVLTTGSNTAGYDFWPVRSLYD